MSGAGPARRRVLLVEDDPGIARFVELALEELDVALQVCRGVADGRAALEAGGIDLLITDLMLPDGIGTELLALTPAPPWRIVFSAGLGAGMRERLQRLGVQQVLDKPASLAALMQAVERGLAGTPTPPAAGAPAAAKHDDVVREHFGGDAALFAAYRAATVAQFAADLDEGERCVAARDLPALRRLGHNLKTVFTLLGDAPAGETARAIERAAQAGDDGALARWPALREALQRWRAPG